MSSLSLCNLRLREVCMNSSLSERPPLSNLRVIYFLSISRHEALFSLFNKLGSQHFELTQVEFEQRRILDPNDIKELEIDRNWYISQIRNRFSNGFVTKEMVQLLNCLEYNEIISFMRTKEFNKSNLKDCLKLGLCTSPKEAKSVLLKATVDCVLENVGNIANKIDFKSQVGMINFVLFFYFCNFLKLQYSTSSNIYSINKCEE